MPLFQPDQISLIPSYIETPLKPRKRVTRRSQGMPHHETSIPATILAQALIWALELGVQISLTQRL